MTDSPDTSNYTPDEPDIAPATERFASAEDVVSKARDIAAEGDDEPVGDIPPASETRRDTRQAEEEADPKEDTTEPDEAEEEAGEATSKVTLGDEEFDADEVKSWRDSHKQQAAFDRLYREKQTELKDVYETLVSEEKRIKTERAQIDEERAQVERFKKYLIRQGIEAGDPFSEEVGQGMDLEDEPRARRSQAKKPLTTEDLEKWYSERRAKEREQETYQSKQEKITRGFDTWVNDALDHAGLEKNTPAWKTVRKAVAFDFYTKFKDDPNSVMRLEDGEISSLLRQYAREYGRDFRQARERDLDTTATKMAGKKLPVTPRNPGTPLPDQASPSRRRNTLERLENDHHGDLDAYFDAVRQDSLRMADELNRKG